MYPKQRINVRPITSNPVLKKRVSSMNQKCLAQDINKSLQLDIEKTKLEMQFAIDVERKKTETNKQIIQQAFMETKDLLNDVTHKKIQILQKSNEETLNHLSQAHQQELIKQHQYYSQQLEQTQKAYQMKEEEIKFMYQNNIAQMKMQMQTNFDYQLEQYRSQFQRERNEMNERHRWDLKLLKEKQNEQIKYPIYYVRAVIDRLNREHETKINEQLYQVTNHYETELDKYRQQLNYFEKQIQLLNSQISNKFSEVINTQTQVIQTEAIHFKDQYIQTDMIVQIIEPTFYTDYEQLQKNNITYKKQILDLKKENQSLKVSLTEVEQLINFQT